MINFKVGIIGTGSIAEKVADTLQKLSAFEPYAVASRDIDKANAFGDKYGVTKMYGSYEELCNDPDVELVYIATPNSVHAENAKLALNAGKPVLVEKPFSYDAKTTEEVLGLARQKNLFAGEAMWIRFLPMYERIAFLVGQGVIGNVFNITSNLSYKIFDKERIKDLSLGGGVLLDLGVYPINLLRMIMGGAPAQINASCAKFETGADAQLSLQFAFEGGRTASAFVSSMYKGNNGAIIFGDKGYIEIDNINNPEGFRVYQGDQKIMEINPPETQISGYEYQFIAARDCIIKGEVEFRAHSHVNTIETMQLLDSIRDAIKVEFPM